MAKVKIPKRVAGVKIPKKVRKKAKKALKMADNPVVREAAVAALGAAGAARQAREQSRAAANDLGPRGDGPRAIDGEALAEAIREVALDGVRRFLEGFEEGLRKASAAVGDVAASVDAEGDDAGKRRPSRPAEDAAADAGRP